MQNVYRGCMCAGLSSVSLPVLKQEELSVLKRALAWTKEMTLACINWFVQKPRTFFQIKSTSRRREYGNTFAVRKALISTKKFSSSFHLRFLANEANREYEKTAKKLVMTIFQLFVFQTFGKPLSLSKPTQFSHAQIQ